MALLPYFWGTLAPSGIVLGNLTKGSSVQVTNRYRVSYPGFLPRGASSDAAARTELDRLQSRSSDRKGASHVPLLRPNRQSAEAPLLTQYN
jgi:hypothetical protein